jgi:hypothetical protein
MESSDDQQPLKIIAWIAIVAISTVAFSLALACVTPLAAVAALAGARMTRWSGIALVLVAWFANQFVGYFVLTYPRTWDSFAWGAAIGVASVLAGLGARIATWSVHQALISAGLAFAVAFVVYEGVLFAWTAILPSGSDAFSFAVALQILVVNTIAAIGLFAIHMAAVKIGLQPRAASATTSATAA